MFPEATVVVVVVWWAVVVTPDDCTPNGMPENELKFARGNAGNGNPEVGIILGWWEQGVITGNGKLEAGISPAGVETGQGQ